MNIEELEESLVDLLGDNFDIDTDSEGQIIIYTGLREDDEGELEEFVSEEDMEEIDVDPDQEELDELDGDDDEE